MITLAIILFYLFPQIIFRGAVLPFLRGYDPDNMLVEWSNDDFRSIDLWITQIFWPIIPLMAIIGGLCWTVHYLYTRSSDRLQQLGSRARESKLLPKATVERIPEKSEVE